MGKTTVLLLIFFIFFPKTVAFASDIVINEFLVDPSSSQWVELYNKGNSTFDISGWFIDDNGGTQKFTVPNGTTINAGEFKVFESSLFNLNVSSGDIIKLLNGSTVEDSYSYSSGPGENKSYGRQTDGIGEWAVFSTPTKGSSNNSSVPVPTPTLTPTVVPTLTNTPTPTSTPKPTPTPKPPTSIPKISPTIFNTSTIVSNPTDVLVSSKNKSDELNEEESISLPPDVLGENIGSKTAEALSLKNDSTPSPQTTIAKNVKEEDNIFPKIIIAAGVIFLSACAILVFRSFKKERKKEET